MNFFSTEDMPYVTFWLTVVLVVLFIFLIGKTLIFQKTITKGKLKVKSRVDVDPTNDKRVIMVTVVNRCYNNIEMKSFGFKYQYHHYDYLNEYRKKNSINSDVDVYIPLRQSISFSIDIEDFEGKFVSSKIKKISAYVIDSIGRETNENSKLVRKHIVQDFKILELMKKENISDEDRNKKLNKLHKKAESKVSSKKTVMELDIKELKEVSDEKARNLRAKRAKLNVKDERTKPLKVKVERPARERKFRIANFETKSDIMFNDNKAVENINSFVETFEDNGTKPVVEITGRIKEEDVVVAPVVETTPVVETITEIASVQTQKEVVGAPVQQQKPVFEAKLTQAAVRLDDIEDEEEISDDERLERWLIAL